VYVGAGSRNETLQSTGTSYLLQKMASRGTSSMSKTEFLESVDNMGATWTA
jgi:processing peptidase subunit beta